MPEINTEDIVFNGAAKRNSWEGLICLDCEKLIEKYKADSIVCLYCDAKYPVINNVPIIINENKSVFTFNDFLQQKNLFFDISSSGKVKSIIGNLLPSIGLNKASQKNFSIIKGILKSRKEYASILILGGSIEGQGISNFLKVPGFTFVESDVSFGPKTQIILDAHNIPFASKTFDCVIAQAVLEHVVDPEQCVREIHRVLKPDGIAYSEIPFMQQVHGGAYDFTRFSLSGHRRLFRCFGEVKSGAVGGAGTVMAWSYTYLLMALFGYTEKIRLGVKVFARLTGFWIKYLDYLTMKNKRSTDAASGTFFIGTKSENILSDRDLIAYYK